MNWKENAHLFANGSFQVKHDQFGLRYVTGHDYENGIFWCGWIGLSVAECTLIARHPDDMTREEEADFHSLPDEIEIDRWHYPHPANLLYLLSIGVYPFPWPEDGSVIRRTGQ